MTCNARFMRGGWIALALVPVVTFVILSIGCGSSDGAAPEDVRGAAEAHARAAGGGMTFDDPSGGGRLALVFDHVHDGVVETEGGRQVVCVDFKSADGTLYDVDFYVDRTEGSGALLVEDAVIHKVGGKNVLSAERRAELDRRG